MTRAGSIVSLQLDTERGWRGGEAQALLLAKGLRARGQQVEVVARSGSALAEQAARSGVRVHALGMRNEFDLVSAWRIARIARRTGARILHAHSAHALSLALLARSFGGGRARLRVVGARRVDFSIYRNRFFGLNGLKYRAADRLIAVSDAVAEVLRRDGVPGRSIAVVRDGVATGSERPPAEALMELRRRFGLETGCAVLLNVAALVGHKGQTHLVGALPAVLARVPRARAVIVGEGPLEEALKSKAKRLGVEHALVLAGRLEPGAMAACYGLADLVVHPSVGEGLGSVLLEAMAAGAAIVATRAGGIPEVVRDGETGRLVAPGDEAALAGAIVSLLARPDERVRLGACARAWVRAHANEARMVEQTLAVYRRLLSGGARCSV